MKGELNRIQIEQARKLLTQSKIHIKIKNILGCKVGIAGFDGKKGGGDSGQYTGEDFGTYISDLSACGKSNEPINCRYYNGEIKWI